MKKSTKTAIIIAVAVIGGAAVIGAVTGQSSQKSTSETSGTSTSSVASVSSDVKNDDKSSKETSPASTSSTETSAVSEPSTASEPVSSDTPSTPDEPSSAEISELIYDKNGIKITYKGIENTYNVTTKLKFLIENGNDEKYTVQTTDISIDDYTYSTIMSTSVAAKKKASDSIVFLDSTFKENGTSYDKIKTAEIGLVIWGESNVLDQIKDTVTFTIQ